MVKRHHKEFDEELCTRFRHLKRYIVKADKQHYICKLCKSNKSGKSEPKLFEYFSKHMKSAGHFKATPDSEKCDLQEVLNYLSDQKAEIEAAQGKERPEKTQIIVPKEISNSESQQKQQKDFLQQLDGGG